MRNPKTLCRDHSLYSYQALKGAELMAQAITEDILAILNTASTKPLYERIAEYFTCKQSKH